MMTTTTVIAAASATAALNRFLHMHRLAPGGAASASAAAANLVSMGDTVLNIFAGKFFIPEDKYDEFFSCTFAARSRTRTAIVCVRRPIPHSARCALTWT